MYKKATVSINELETNKADYYIVSALVKQRIHNRYSLIQDKLYILVCHPLPMKGEVALVLQYIYVAPKSCTQSFKKIKNSLQNIERIWNFGVSGVFDNSLLLCIWCWLNSSVSPSPSIWEETLDIDLPPWLAENYVVEYDKFVENVFW